MTDASPPTSQSWCAHQYSDHAAFVSELAAPVLDLLNPQPGEHILDLGCGNGTLAANIQRAGATVVGVDASPSMVAAARENGIDAQVMSGEALTFQNEFDAVFSNAALHWMPEFKTVIQGVYAALKHGGRFVGEFGGAGNIQHLIEAMSAAFAKFPELGEFSTPWYFPTDQAYARALEDQGFQVPVIQLIPRPTPLKTGVREWLKIFADYLLYSMDAETAELFLDQVEQQAKPRLFSPEQGWVADYVRLRFVALKTP
jgi:2-isopropylmalate synthase